MDLVQFTESFLPVLRTAGRYALSIQKKVDKRKKEHHSGDFGEALTDADLSVQNLLEVTLISSFPSVGFYGEENASSLNHKYFPKDSDYILYADPINGTLLYQHGLPLFDIIISVAYRGKLVSAVTYLPAKDLFFLAVDGVGAKVVRGGGDLKIVSGQPILLKDDANLVYTFRSQSLKEKVEKEFKFLDSEQAFRAGDHSVTLNGVFEGKLSAFFCYNVHLIDWGAIAFIFSQAGGVVTDDQGNALPNINSLKDGYYPSIVGGVNKEVHRRLLSVLKKDI